MEMFIRPQNPLPESPATILFNRIGAKIPVCKHRGNPLIGFVLGLEEQRLLADAMGATVRAPIGAVVTADSRPTPARFMNFDLVFVNLPTFCEPFFLARL